MQYTDADEARGVDFDGGLLAFYHLFFFGLGGAEAGGGGGGGVTVGVPHVADEAHGGRAERVVAGEFHFGDEDTALVGGVGGAGD